jgi:hypothetical protein
MIIVGLGIVIRQHDESSCHFDVVSELFSRCRHGDGDGMDMEEEKLRRITYPFRFGQQTAKEEAWRESRIQ